MIVYNRTQNKIVDTKYIILFRVVSNVKDHEIIMYTLKNNGYTIYKNIDKSRCEMMLKHIFDSMESGAEFLEISEG